MNRRHFLTALTAAPFALTTLPTSARELWEASVIRSYHLQGAAQSWGVTLYACPSPDNARMLYRQKIREHMALIDILGFTDYESVPILHDLDQTSMRHIIGNNPIVNDVNAVNIISMRDTLIVSSLVTWVGDVDNPILENALTEYSSWLEGIRGGIDSPSPDTLQRLLPTSLPLFPEMEYDASEDVLRTS